MRVVFLGTPDFALPSLRALVNSRFEVCAVVTQPDRPGMARFSRAGFLTCLGWLPSMCMLLSSQSIAARRLSREPC